MGALGCERGVQVSLVGLHAPVTSRLALARGSCCRRRHGRCTPRQDLHAALVVAQYPVTPGIR
jgi:hypothetical protein